MVANSTAIVYRFLRMDIMKFSKAYLEKFYSKHSKLTSSLDYLCCLFGIHVLNLTETNLLCIPKKTYYHDMG